MKSKFFTLARKLAQSSDYEQHPMGAVIARGNKLISVGFNRKRTHPMSKTRFANTHAELAAIINARGDLRGAEIYIYRETRNGELAMARPCEHCQQLIRDFGIRTSYYSTEKGYVEESF
jgi:deoxycytidylate deaminase